MNCPDGMHVDHINHNTLDNRKENLRICTNSENQMNKGKYKNNKSGYKGVCLKKSTGKWSASIKINKKQKYLGCFDDPKDAYRAYCNASRKNHGEYSYRNLDDSFGDTSKK
jgi:hypothetical protein